MTEFQLIKFFTNIRYLYNLTKFRFFDFFLFLLDLAHLYSFIKAKFARLRPVNIQSDNLIHYDLSQTSPLLYFFLKLDKSTYKLYCFYTNLQIE